MLVLADTIFPLPGYRIIEEIYWGNKTIVYRGIREQDNKLVIVKLMRNEYPTFKEITKFRNQYTITKNLNIAGIVKPLSLEIYRNGYALVMEDFGGISLKHWLKEKAENGIGLKEFFHIAIEIVSIIGELHRDAYGGLRLRIIHKDIKPSNILINPNTLEVKLIDFSIATLLPREVQFFANPNILEGTLAYISPEQTGRMNRGIDYRSDFYSLGVTFFELLTGQLPFTSTDPMELIYSHIAKQPDQFKIPYGNTKDVQNLKFSNEQAIPQVLCDIVMKLMAKNAENRYQSANGLQHDLEICSQQWQETGKIAAFELGTKDISDRFLIPEKLYGRQREVETLLAAFERVVGGTTEMILVAGFSGIGKTAVVNEVHKPISRQRSYFIQGKFDQFERDIPLSGLVQALGDLIEQLLSETDEQIQQWKTKILYALGTQAQVMIDVIPELEWIIGKQPEIDELSVSTAQHRFNLLFQRFIQVFTTKEHPLVIFLDDLQWADTASLKLIQLLIYQTNAVNKELSLSFTKRTDNGLISILEGAGLESDEGQNFDETVGKFLVIGAYRDNEVSKAHPLYLTLQEMGKAGVNVNRITLTPLNQSNLNLLISDTLGCQESVSITLTQMVFAKTKGNPFFATQFIKSLHNDGIIKFNFELGYWQYSLEELQALALTEDVVEFMALQIKKLPKLTQEALKLAACIGNEFDLRTLAIVYEKSVIDTASDVWKALHEGLILPQMEVYQFSQNTDLSTDIVASKEANKFQSPKYKFIHDRVQQAAYSLIPDDQKKQIHLKIGQLLLSNILVAEREEKVFQLVNQFNIAVKFITDQTKRNELAAMNLIAGRKALASTAYPAALKYLNIGIQLLADDSWETQYELKLALCETAAESAYLCGEFEQMEQLVEVVLSQAKTLQEKVKVYEIKIQAYTSQNKLLEAIAIARLSLQQFGVIFPQAPTEVDIQQGLHETAVLLAGKTMEDLNNLPLMESTKHLTIVRIVSSVIPATYLADPLLFPLLILSQVNLSIQYGNAPLSSFCYACYGILLNGIKKDIEAADQFGKLALSLVSKFNHKAMAARTLFVIGAFIIHGKSHIRETLPILLEGYQTALETGNLEFVGYCAKDICQHSYLIGQELATLEPEIQSYTHALIRMKQATTSQYCQIYWQVVLNLLGKSNNTCDLLGEAYNENESLPLLIEANDITGLHYFYFHKLILCYYFGNFTQAQENAVKVQQYLAGGTGFITIPIFYFYDSLTLLANYPQTKLEQEYLLKRVADNQAKLKERADYAPINYLHKFYLVEAERYRVIEQYIEAMEFYDRAISLAKEHEYINDEALANELATKFYLEWGKQKIAQTYLTDAYYCYSRWGAKAKVDDLAKHYPQLLAPVLQQEKISYYLHGTTNTSAHESPFSPSNYQTVIDSKTSVIDSLDFAAVIKASQALSGEIELKQLLSTLMQVVMENAGASKCALILNEGEHLGLTIIAVSSDSEFAPICKEFPSIPPESSYQIPLTLVNYVKRTQEIFVTDNAKTFAFLASDRYIIREQPKSLLCLPVINQGNLLGILYLENNLATGAFTSDRLEVLQLLTTQAAISLKNAILYKKLTQANEKLAEYNYKLEEKAEKRTQAIQEQNQRLQQALQELQRTQTQLIQSEKMSSLGQTLSGISHEVNNPINSISTNIDRTSDYVQDLLDLIAIYQQEYPNPSNLVQQKAIEIEVDYLTKYLPKILDSLKAGGSRIRNIFLRLGNLSRPDDGDL